MTGNLPELLLDPHVLIWLLQDDPHMLESVYAEIQFAESENRVIISAITPWEIGLHTAKKRIDLGMDANCWIDHAFSIPGIRLQQLLPAIAIASSNLPFETHSDTADHILVATARHIGATLITADELLLRHGAAGQFRCLSAI